jgi:hypothetical protein
VNDLTDFLENALYDPALVHFDPQSTTRTLEPNAQDLTYSTFRPDLAALGAVDGRMPSGLPRSNNDALSRRDMGLEFLDVTRLLDTVRIESNQIAGGRQEDVYRITNTSSSPVDTHLVMIVGRLSTQVRMENASGVASTGDPYLRAFLPNGVLLPGQSIVIRLLFKEPPQLSPVTYGITLLSGQGNP